MSNGIVTQAADRRGPLSVTGLPGNVNPLKVCIAASGSSQNIDLSSSSYFNTDKYTDHYISMSVEGGASLWWYWSASASDTIDKTATGNGITVGAFCPSGIVQDERPTGRYLVLQTSAAANVHVWISSGKF